MIKTGLVGFGKTGKSVASALLKNPDIELVWVLRKSARQEKRDVADLLEIDTVESAKVYALSNTQVTELLEEQPVDLIIDFSSESGIYDYAEAAADKGVKIISAVSHYEEKEINLLKKLAKKTTVFWSPNITLGVNYLIFAAKFLKSIAPGVDVEIIEEHFRQKSGVSGTALKIAEALGLKKSKINSVRAGGIVGRHEVIFGFKHQTIRLIHESISREAFGNGVIFVAQHLMEKDKGFYTYEDILNPYKENK